MKKILLCAACICAPALAGAEQWQVLGTRPMGMGGAFVAVAQGPVAQYWNPAGLAMESSQTVSGMEIPVGVNLEMTGGIMKNASEIGDMADQLSAIKDAQTHNTAVTPAQAADFVKTMSLLAAMNDKGKGVLLEANGGANFKFSKIAVSVNNFTSVGMNPYIDTSNLNLGTNSNGINFSGNSISTLNDASYSSARSDLENALDQLGTGNALKLICGTGNCGDAITSNAELSYALVNYAQSMGISTSQLEQAAATITQYATGAAPIITGALSGGSVDGNQSNLKLDAASFTEVAFGYGRYLGFLDGLSLGGNIKMVNGRMATSEFEFMNNSKTGDAFKNMLNDAKSSWAPAVDMGAMWDISRKYPGVPMHPKIGIVGRNLNSPRFDKPVSEGGKYTLDRQVRAGLAFKPLNFWNIAADMDLTKNKTAVDGYDSRQLALGTEINVINRKAFNIPLRAGIMKNTAEKASKTAYTVGTGLNLLYMHFDVSAAISSDRTKLDDKNVPTHVAVGASFGLLF